MGRLKVVGVRFALQRNRMYSEHLIRIHFLEKMGRRPLPRVAAPLYPLRNVLLSWLYRAERQSRNRYGVKDL